MGTALSIGARQIYTDPAETGIDWQGNSRREGEAEEQTKRRGSGVVWSAGVRYYNYYGEGNLDQDLADLHLHIQNDTFEIIYLYKTPLAEFQWTNLVFYHVYLIFYTSTREGGFWWSLEKNEECLLLQVSRDIDDVKDKREGVLRVSPKNSWYWEPQYIKRDSCWVKFEDLYRFLILDQDLSNVRYNFATENCKGFAKIIFDKTANNKRWHYVI